MDNDSTLGDILLCVFIVLTVIIMIVFLNLLTTFRKTKNNLSDIKCNPMFIPFADFFGLDAEENSKQCSKYAQTENIKDSHTGIKNKQKDLSNTADNLGKNHTAIKSSLGNMSNIIGSVTNGITSLMSNTIIEFQQMVFHIMSLTKKILFTGNVLINITSTGVDTGGSIVNGPVMKTMSKLCFDPNTIITLKNGKKTTIQNCKINDVLQNGSVVIGHVSVKNLHNDFFYELDNDGVKIHVTGSHLVFDKRQKRFVELKDSSLPKKKTNIRKKMFHCLITDDHLIQIGKYTFWDWEDDVCPLL